VLAALLVHTGCVPLARDAAERAVALSSDCEPRVRGWAWIEKGEVLAAAQRFAEAREAFLVARTHVLAAADRPHEVKVEGNVGACYHGLGHFKQARVRYVKAVELARRHELPASEAHWMVELSRLSLDEGRLEPAEQWARAALRIAKPSNQVLTTFRAEWLLHRARCAAAPGDPDRHRVAYLKKLYARLEEHRGSAEVREFSRRYCGAADPTVDEESS
jgi:tetratricopeptide (TPR) repeat protein